jgi:hypothetical protein
VKILSWLRRLNNRLGPQLSPPMEISIDTSLTDGSIDIKIGVKELR